MKINEILLIICFCAPLGSCAQTNSEAKRMENNIQEIHSRVKTFKEKPVYGVQVDKTGCRLIIEMKNNIDYAFTESNGESMSLPLNVMITNSGMQVATIRIYPKAGDEYITKLAMANLTFYHASDPDNLNEYKQIAKFSLPEGLEAKKLSYYEAKVQFEAKVPWDYSAELAQANDLKKIPDIESKLLDQYDKMTALLQKFDRVSYSKESIHASRRVYEPLYQASIEEIRAGENDTIAVLDNRIEDRKFLPVSNYIIRYYANGKIAALWNKDSLEGALRLSGRSKKADGTYKEFLGSDPLYLYMPAGSNELKVW